MFEKIVGEIPAAYPRSHPASVEWLSCFKDRFFFPVSIFLSLFVYMGS
jgi:hypothetical protein